MNFFLEGGPNSPQNRAFRFFRKILSLVSLGNNLKWKLILLLIFNTNPMSGKALGFQLWAQMLSANKMTGFFKMSYLKEEVNDELYFLHVDKHWSVLQVDTIILVVYNQACPKYPKQVCISLQYLQKSMGWEIDFLPADKNKIFCKLIISLWVSIARHAQSTQNNKFTTSLQYLKEVKDEVEFCLLIMNI